jgi:16S rRNA (cytidine1402-2'-O)-methyltransferase
MPVVYLIPSVLHEEGYSSIPESVGQAIRDCQVFFVENERTTRRFFKKIWKEMAIDDYEWQTIHKAEEEVKGIFQQRIRENKNIGIVSEAGCPGIADPGQILVSVAHELGASVRPLVGPNSILLALMASGMNGQQFRFNGYLPIEAAERARALQELESESAKKNYTQIFIETPYRNNQLFETILKTCKPNTRISVAAELNSPMEFIKTMTVSEWKKQVPDLHKKPSIFLLLAY